MSTDGPAADEWLAGTATATITPDADAPHHLRGFTAREGPMEDVDEDLHAKVLALEDGTGQRLLVVTYEAISVPPELRDTLEAACADRWDLSPAALVTNPSHTHYGPNTRYRPEDLDADAPEHERVSAEWRAELESTLLDLLDEAVADLSPASLSYNHARCGIAMSRRALADDTVHFGPYPDGPYDHDVPVLVVERDDAVETILFGYACHTTSLAHYNQVSGDYAGYAMAALEEEFPEATALFMIGCGGDQKAYPQGDRSRTKHYGRALKNAVQVAIEARSREPVTGPLSLRKETITLERADHEAGPTAETLSTQRYPIQAVGFGNDLTMLSLAGEVVVEYALAIKEQLAEPVWIAAYSEYAGYIPTRRVLAEGGYEARTSGRGEGRYRPETEEQVIDTATAVAERVGATRTTEP